MKTGGLTPRANGTVRTVRYSGGFGQLDGFRSVLTAAVRTDGRLVLTLEYRALGDEQAWTVELTQEQRRHLASWIGEYEPVLFEDVPQ